MRGARAAVRLLHAGHDDGRQGAARRQPRPDRGRRSARRSPAICRCTGYQNIVQSVPLGGRQAAIRTRSSMTTRVANAVTRHCDDDQDRRPGRQPQARRGRPRFIRGQGNYVDDIALPGMLHMAILRSPLCRTPASSHRHQRGAGTSQGRSGASPARRWRRRNLAWMPTLSYDTQAVLATDKVRFQGQEVAFVIADDRYIARDALRAHRRRVRAAARGRQRRARRSTRTRR